MLEFLRKFKLSYQLYNFFNKKQLEHNLPLYRKYGLNKKYHSPISSLDFKDLDSPLPRYDEKNSAVAMQDDPKFKALPQEVQPHLLPWSEKGYAIIPTFLSEKEVDEINEEVQKLINDGMKTRYNNKIMFAYRKSTLLKELATGKKMTDVLDTLLGTPVEIFQSINFITGSQQRTHSDSIHMTTFPYGNMIAVWIALEDITEDCGPLHYYPGSHKLPYILNSDYDNEGTSWKIGSKMYDAYEDKVEEVLNENAFEKKVFLAKKGDILIWHANLLHGGEAIQREGSTRKSMVLHYYAKDAICFHEVTQRPALK